jgi:hypothetical protein
MSNSEQVFKLINPLIYHEYWYRPLECKGDYMINSYDANHRYKVNINHYYTTYLPHEAYTTETMLQLERQQEDVHFGKPQSAVQSGYKEIDFNTGARLKTGEIHLKISSRDQHVIFYYELGVL